MLVEVTSRKRIKDQIIENNSKETETTYGGYKGNTTLQPLEAPNGVEENPAESYQPPTDEGDQQPEAPYSFQQPEYGYQQQPLSLSQQPYESPPVGEMSAYERTSLGIRVCTAAWLSYLGGWVTGLILLLLEKENRIVRFHAMQFLIFFGVMSIHGVQLHSLSWFHRERVGVVSFVCWIVLMITAARGRYYKLPIIGDYAEQWANADKG